MSNPPKVTVRNDVAELPCTRCGLSYPVADYMRSSTYPHYGYQAGVSMWGAPVFTGWGGICRECRTKKKHETLSKKLGISAPQSADTVLHGYGRVRFVNRELLDSGAVRSQIAFEVDGVHVLLQATDDRFEHFDIESPVRLVLTSGHY